MVVFFLEFRKRLPSWPGNQEGMTSVQSSEHVLGSELGGGGVGRKHLSPRGQEGAASVQYSEPTLGSVFVGGGLDEFQGFVASLSVVDDHLTILDAQVRVLRIEISEIKKALQHMTIADHAASLEVHESNRKLREKVETLAVALENGFPCNAQIREIHGVAKQIDENVNGLHVEIMELKQDLLNNSGQDAEF